MLSTSLAIFCVQRARIWMRSVDAYVYGQKQGQ